MKITDFKKEDLETGGLIRRKDWDSNISIGLSTSKIDFIYYENSKPKKPTTFFRGLVQDIMADDWELTGKLTQVWEPEEGGTYFYINSLGLVESETYDSDTYIDNARLEFTNIFRTEEEANIMAIKLQIIAKLRKLSNVDFNEDFDEQKWYITYNHRTKSIECDTTYHVQRMPFCIYFKNQEDCGNAIDTIGEENLKKYYFDVEEEE